MLDWMASGDWNKFLEEYDLDKDYHEPLLVWVRPSLDMLQFLESQLLGLGYETILSIGCGCACLEWLLSKATRLKVEGLEVNSGWWESDYSTPHFIPLTYTEPGKIPALAKDKPLLFCYFNNIDFFHEYLEAFEGDCVVLIGPVDGEKHCDPEPGYLEKNLGHVWKLLAVHDIRNEGTDLVAVYVRK